MLFQDPVQTIVNNTLRARCDMCTIGKLRHPGTQGLLQKSTQILTTSQIMYQYLENQRCNQDHHHDSVAGGYKTKDGSWKRVSEYTELYTALFSRRIARILEASKRVSEHAIFNADMVFAGEEEDRLPEPEVKRRRLTLKVSSPPGYPDAPASGSAANPPKLENVSLRSDDAESNSKPVLPPPSEQVSVKEILHKALQQAPRVGSMVLENGDLFDSLQMAFPARQLRVVELCKGTDRYRKPPIRLMPHEASWRMTLGIHRHSLEPLPASDWENWERMSNRKMCSPGPPARLLVTLFGRDIESPKRQLEEQGNSPLKKSKTNNQELPILDNPLALDINNPLPPKSVSERPHETELEQLQQSVITHGPKFMQLSPQERHWLSKIHHNLGHPGHNKLQAVLKMQGYDDKLIQGLTDFRCSTCHELQRPKIARPAHLADPREFNDCVGCDLVTWTAKNGKQYQFFHCIDAATNFQMAMPVIRTDASSLHETFRDCWLSWAGPCRQLVIDNDSALCSEQFTQLMQGLDVHLRVVAGYAHWQLGKTERHGDILQHMLERCDQDHGIENEDQFKQTLQHICNAKNSLSRAKGYTPEILVLGKSRALPGSNCEDILSPSQYLADADTPEGVQFQQQLKGRERARMAFIEADNSERLRRAFLRRQRPHRGHFSGGSFVMFWRPGKGENPGQWTGPARVIIQENQEVVWISHSSRVYRVAPEHVRTLSEREAAASLDSMSTEPLNMPMRDHGKGIFQYEDLTEMIPARSGPNANARVTPVPDENLLEGSQPDSEPSLPVPPESSGYSATPPLSEEPEAQTPRPEDDETEKLLDPKDVPIPDDSDDGLHVEDYWIQQGDKVIRVHRRPRTLAFDPVLTLDCPVDILQVGHERTTVACIHNQPVCTKRDNWGNIEDEWVSEQPWTGMTIFSVVQDGGTCETEICDAMVMSHDQILECEIFLTQEDLLGIAASPREVPALLASAVKRQRAEVKLKDLETHQKEEFQNAKNKEIDQWLATETVRKILRHKVPEENILRCRWVLTYKDLDSVDAAREGKTKKAKARLVILGYEDPDLTNIPRDSPTLQKESRSLLLQMSASKRWRIRSFDIKTAFLRGSRRDNRLLGVEPPEEMRSRMNLKDTEICELLKSAYGLVNAPYLWYQELRENLIALNFTISPLDPCLFSLADADGTVHGLIGMHVDDGLCAGDQVFLNTLDLLEQKFPFGSKRDTDFIFTGIHIHQDDQYNIHLDQTEYVRSIDPIAIDRNRRAKEQLEVSDSERQGLRGLIGSLQYAATNTRPDIAAKLSFLQSKINCARISDLLDANRLLGEAKKYAQVAITISNIPCQDIRFVSYSDASFATREKKQSQKGCIILAAHKDVMEQKNARSSTLGWFSKKIDRVVASTLAAETYSLSSAVDLLDWMRLAWEWMKCPLIPWKTPELVWKDAPPSIAVVDCKSLFDVITKNTTPQCQEHRTLIEALVIKDHIQSGIRPHWVHSAAQLADALTKAMDGFRLREFLRSCICCLHDVAEILKERADRKAQKLWLSQATNLENTMRPENGVFVNKHL